MDGALVGVGRAVVGLGLLQGLLLGLGPGRRDGGAVVLGEGRVQGLEPQGPEGRHQQAHGHEGARGPGPGSLTDAGADPDQREGEADRQAEGEDEVPCGESAGDLLRRHAARARGQRSVGSRELHAAREEAEDSGSKDEGDGQEAVLHGRDPGWARGQEARSRVAGPALTVSTDQRARVTRPLPFLGQQSLARGAIWETRSSAPTACSIRRDRKREVPREPLVTARPSPLQAHAPSAGHPAQRRIPRIELPYGRLLSAGRLDRAPHRARPGSGRARRSRRCRAPAAGPAAEAWGSAGGG